MTKPKYYTHWFLYVLGIVLIVWLKGWGLWLKLFFKTQRAWTLQHCAVDDGSCVTLLTFFVFYSLVLPLFIFAIDEKILRLHSGLTKPPKKTRLQNIATLILILCSFFLDKKWTKKSSEFIGHCYAPFSFEATCLSLSRCNSASSFIMTENSRKGYD